MNYKILSLKNIEEWNSFMSKIPIEQQDIYYSPEYYNLYENYGDGKAQCFVFEKDGEIALYPFLINSVNNLGYDLNDEYFDIQGAYGYNGVVSSSMDRYFIQYFYSSFNEYCITNNIIAEFTRFHPLIKNEIYSKNHLKIIFDRITVFIDVNKPETILWSEIQRTTKKQIKRGEKRYNISVRRLEGKDKDPEIFTSIYWDSMKRVNSTDYLFFDVNYFNELLSLSNVIQYIAFINDQPISTIVALVGSKFLHGHLGGTIDQYLNLSPFSILYWEMIKTAKEKKLSYLHVGGGTTSKENDRVFQYKKHFSNLTGRFYIGKKIYNEAIYEMVVNQWKTKYPDSYNKNSIKLLGYREI